MSALHKQAAKLFIGTMIATGISLGANAESMYGKEKPKKAPPANTLTSTNSNYVKPTIHASPEVENSVTTGPVQTNVDVIGGSPTAFIEHEASNQNSNYNGVHSSNQNSAHQQQGQQQGQQLYNNSPSNADANAIGVGNGGNGFGGEAGSNATSNSHGGSSKLSYTSKDESFSFTATQGTSAAVMAAAGICNEINNDGLALNLAIVMDVVGGSKTKGHHKVADKECLFVVNTLERLLQNDMFRYKMAFLKEQHGHEMLMEIMTHALDRQYRGALQSRTTKANGDVVETYSTANLSANNSATAIEHAAAWLMASNVSTSVKVGKAAAGLGAKMLGENATQDQITHLMLSPFSDEEVASFNGDRASMMDAFNEKIKAQEAGALGIVNPFEGIQKLFANSRYASMKDDSLIMTTIKMPRFKIGEEEVYLLEVDDLRNPPKQQENRDYEYDEYGYN